jgi:hypothetical protein
VWTHDKVNSCVNTKVTWRVGGVGGSNVNVTVRSWMRVRAVDGMAIFSPLSITKFKTFSEISYSITNKFCQFQWKSRTVFHVWTHWFSKLVAGDLVTSPILVFKGLHYWRYRISRSTLHKNTTSIFIRSSRQTAGNIGRANRSSYSLPKHEFCLWITLYIESKICSKMHTPLY